MDGKHGWVFAVKLPVLVKKLHVVKEFIPLMVKKESLVKLNNK